ncbi:hypothetical protein [Mesomycoplasma ovipneumoniae]|uniref:hypothetical protein n=1 Tax=Mesomycoplasma ovipneumoniae TaxID=29562 RepID=UPI00308074E3
MIIKKLKKILGFTLVGLIPATFFSYSSVQNNINLTNQDSQPQLFSYYRGINDHFKLKDILQEIYRSNHKGLSQTPISLASLSGLGYEDQWNFLRTEQGVVQITIRGIKKVVYWGGLFWQDKAAWLGKAEIKYTKNKNFSDYFNNKADRMNLKTHAWITGLATPSFVINGKVVYATEKQDVNAEIGVSTRVEFNSKELVEAFEKSNANRLLMNYQGVGWNYKISGFGQYATGLVIDDYEQTSISTNNPLVPRKY